MWKWVGIGGLQEMNVSIKNAVMWPDVNAVLLYLSLALMHGPIYTHSQ